MADLINLPVVTDDFDGQLAALDHAIREAAIAFKFKYVADAPTFDQIYKVPDLVYRLIEHYTMRGFLCTYDGDAGKLQIAWDYPNMSWLEHREITRSIPEMIPSLGMSFRAGLIYLCMTNGSDLRSESDSTLQTKIGKEIKLAATLGNTSMSFGFPSVPAPAVQSLFAPTFQILEDKGFEITYNPSANIFILKWGTTVPVMATDAQSMAVSLE